MRRAKLVLAALTVALAAFIAVAGPVMADACEFLGFNEFGDALYLCEVDVDFDGIPDDFDDFIDADFDGLDDFHGIATADFLDIDDFDDDDDCDDDDDDCDDDDDDDCDDDDDDDCDDD